MNINLKKTIQAELYKRLSDAWVLSSLDVGCEKGNDVYRLDVALHTRSFIFGRIDVCEPSPSHDTQIMLTKYGMEQRYCDSWGDIDACVAWAVDLQERHMLSQAVCMVA